MRACVTLCVHTRVCVWNRSLFVKNKTYLLKTRHGRWCMFLIGSCLVTGFTFGILVVQGPSLISSFRNTGTEFVSKEVIPLFSY